VGKLLLNGRPARDAAKMAALRKPALRWEALPYMPPTIYHLLFLRREIHAEQEILKARVGAQTIGEGLYSWSVGAGGMLSISQPTLAIPGHAAIPARATNTGRECREAAAPAAGRGR
jgi:hypothetical protein